MRRAELAVWLAGRCLGRLASPSCGGSDAGNWRADEQLIVVRELLDAELRVIEFARVHVVERGASV